MDHLRVYERPLEPRPIGVLEVERATAAPIGVRIAHVATSRIEVLRQVAVHIAHQEAVVRVREAAASVVLEVVQGVRVAFAVQAVHRGLQVLGLPEEEVVVEDNKPKTKIS